MGSSGRRSTSYATLAAALVLAHSAFATADSLSYSADQTGWRFWSAAEGLTEGYTTILTKLPGGRVAVRHGDVGTFDILDGFDVKSVPDRHWLGRIYEDGNGVLYTFNEQGIAIYQNGDWSLRKIPEIDALADLKKFAFRTWFTYPTQQPGSREVAAAVIPTAPGAALILVNERILEWQRASGRVRLVRTAGQTRLTKFLDLEPGPAGSVWVMGKTGFGRMTRVNGDSPLYNWEEFHPAVPDLTSFAGAAEDAKGIFITARTVSGTVALRIDGNKAAVVGSVAGDKGRLWPGLGNRVWKTDGSEISYIEGSHTVNLLPSPELAGQILDVLPLRSGGFWLALSQKLAHYAPPLWQEPVGAPRLTSLVNSIAEDKQGRLWFAADRTLLLNIQDEWHEYSLPQGEEFRVTNPRSLTFLEDGRILLDVESDDHHLRFDPRTGRFERYTRPGLYLGLTLPRWAGGLWVESYAPSARTLKFEILEHGSYRPVPGMADIPMADVRDLLAARNGDIWLGTSRYLARVHNGVLRMLTAADGFKDSGAYAFFERSDGSILIGGRQGVTVWDGSKFGPLETDPDRARSFAQTPDGIDWTASGKGVFRLQNGSWIENSKQEGLPGAPYTVFCDTRGRLWAGTTFGIRLYHPEADRDSPRTRISEERNLRRTPPGGEVRLNFGASDKWKSTPEDRLLYSWSLDEGPWSRFRSDSFASFRSMPAGRHGFRVRAMDRNGNIDSHPAAFEFSVLRHWFTEPLFLLLLLIAVIAVGALVRVVAQRHRRLEFESRHDPLTRLLNRAAFESALDRAIDAASHSGPLSVIFLDLDGFKQVNDTLGHRVGDLLLVAISRRIDACLRGADARKRGSTQSAVPSLARIGGDEFSIVLPDAGAQTAERVAMRILEAVRSCASIEGHAVRVSCSIGISIYPTHGTDAATLLRLADVAMYRGKAGSKDCFQVFDPASSRVDFRNSGMAVAVRESLENDYLYLLYQPIQNARGAIVEFEALARIHHPDRGEITPSDFIPVAEDTGLIVPLGNRVLREALRQARLWQDRDLPVRVAVNVSAIQLDDPAFADTVFEYIDRAGVPPVALALEVTESALARSWEAVTPQIQRLRAAGVSISLDDFGIGYSSFSRLHTLPIDCVKIDQSFVSGMSGDSRNLNLVSDTIALAHRLGYVVVGEGVESAEQINALQAMDCDRYQGFFLSRPVREEEATVMLTKARELRAAPTLA